MGITMIDVCVSLYICVPMIDDSTFMIEPMKWEMKPISFNDDVTVVLLTRVLHPRGSEVWVP